MKNLQINCPDGHIIDQEKSNLEKGIIEFRKVDEELTYEYIAKLLFNDSQAYYFNNNGNIQPASKIAYDHLKDVNNAKTQEQIESILALNKLCNVAKYLNGDWLPIWSGSSSNYCIYLYEKKSLRVTSFNSSSYSTVWFKSKALAEQAIEILGEEEIKKALTLNH